MTYLAGSEKGSSSYEREYRNRAACRKAIAHCAEWIKLVPWDLFCTFTFAWKASDQQADEAFARFINQLERKLRSDVGYVRGDEKRFSGCGKPACGRHFHVLLTSAAIMASKDVEELWTSVAGQRSDDAGALVVPFNPSLNGVAYVLKLINQAGGDWSFRNLHLFHPSATPEMFKLRWRRHLRRHRSRVQRFAAALPDLTNTTYGGKEC
jgi:hypothetical protein